MLIMEYKIKSIRDNFTQFGYDLSHLTDKEIEQGIIETAKAIHNSFDEATRAVLEFSKVLNEINS